VAAAKSSKREGKTREEKEREMHAGGDERETREWELDEEIRRAGEVPI
jgi:hypothetical protein